MFSGLIIFSLLVSLVAAIAIFYWKTFKLEKEIQKREEKVKHKLYELAILKEIGERIGYSLDVQKIIDIITGSLNQFIGYSVVSYMLLEPEKVIFKVHLERSVARKFIDTIKERMTQSLLALLGKDHLDVKIEESLSGALLTEEIEEPVQSFFNIPLIIGDKVVGILTVADTKQGLYKEEDMTILYKLTKQASQAVTRLQEVIEIEQRKLNSMVQSMNEGVVMTDKDYRIMVMNPAAKKITGLENKPEVTIFDLIDSMSGKFDIRGKLEESVKLDKVLTINDVVIGDRFLQVFISPVKSRLGSSSGEIEGGVVIFHDKTREKEVEKMREDFTSMMVHELRSPLDGIKKITEFMKTSNSSINDQVYHDNMTMVHKASSDMLELVNDLLDVAKIESGKFEIISEPLDIKKIIASRLSFFNISAKDATITLKTQFSEDVPALVNCDLLRISQVLNNLLSNALKFTKTGGEIVVQSFLHKVGEDINSEAVKAGMKWFADTHNDLKTIGDSLVVAVTDSGVGIHASSILQLFDKFKQFRFTSVHGDHKGTGLGLSIVKGIVESHHGSIGVGSEEGVGSTFYFTIPIKG